MKTPLERCWKIWTAQTDAKKLLSAARIALLEGNLDLAEDLAHRSENAASGWRFWAWGDKPDKVLKEIAAARTRTASGVEIRGNRSPNEVAPAITGNRSMAAREYLKQGRLALQANDLVKAKASAEQAQALTADFRWWEDNPGKLLVDIQRAVERNPQALANAPATPPMSPNSAAAASDSRSQLKAARDLFNAGKLDESEKMAQRLQGSGDTTWGLFEDSPDKLLVELRKARAQHDHEEAARLMLEARKLFAQGNLEGAKATAYRAEVLHGPYDIWDTSERPAKLIAEINVAQSKSRTGSSTAAAEATMKKDSLEASFDGHAMPPAIPSMPSAPMDIGSRPSGMRAMDSDPSRQPLDPTADSDRAAMRAVLEDVNPPPSFSSFPSDATKQHALDLMAECKRLQKEGRLVEARKTALEAQKTRATFRAEEDRPERALAELEGLARHRIEFLLQEATDYAATGHMEPSRFQKAEQNLEQAQKLGAGVLVRHPSNRDQDGLGAENARSGCQVARSRHGKRTGRRQRTCRDRRASDAALGEQPSTVVGRREGGFRAACEGANRAQPG